MYTPVSPSFIIEVRRNWVKLCCLDGHQSFNKQIKPIKMGKLIGKRTIGNLPGVNAWSASYVQKNETVLINATSLATP